VERLRQILVLRKMQIPVKDIIRIYESEDTGALVEAFVRKLRAIDEQMGALGELRRVVDDFLRAMTEHGVSKITALPLLYDRMDQEITRLAKAPPVSMAQLSALSERLAAPLELSIVDIPSFRALCSRERDSGISKPADFWAWCARRGLGANGLSFPGGHRMFEYQGEDGQPVILIKVPDEFVSDGPYEDYHFAGGLFASAGVYADEDMDLVFQRMIEALGENPYYEVDYLEGKPRHASLMETVISPDDQREKAEILVAVRRTVPDPSRYPKALQVSDMSAEALDHLHQPLHINRPALGSLTPILHPHYVILDSGEAEYIGWVENRVLSTNVPVSVPFRVDYEFMTDEAPVFLYHGRARLGINMGDNTAGWCSRDMMKIRQPVFGDETELPGQGAIKKDGYNHLTWIVGQTHMAVTVNGELRYCGCDFAYMKTSQAVKEAHPVIIGAGHSYKTLIRSIEITQLLQNLKISAKEGTLSMITNRANNRIPVIHQLITNRYGENYWFNGCMKYLMECLGEKQMDYWFFSGLNGDNLAQVFSFDRPRGEGVSDYLMAPEFISRIFEACGYQCSFVSRKELNANKELYLTALMSYIDRGLPVICAAMQWNVAVGYEGHGRTLLRITGENTEPEAFATQGYIDEDWIFSGAKIRDVDIAAVYRDVVMDMPRLLRTRTEGYCFGADAFRAWADKIESGGFDDMRPEDFDQWEMYNVYVCNVATNGSCRAFLERALELNPDMSFLGEVIELYKQLGRLWEGGGGKTECLESLGGGFNISLETLQDKAKRAPISEIIRQCAEVTDQIVRAVEGAANRRG